VTTKNQQMFHGKFIPNDPHRLPFAVRFVIGIGLGILLAILALISMNVLKSKGEWVTLLLVSVITASALGLWVRDAIKHPATSIDDDET
jgi:hypothetical protein